MIRARLARLAEPVLAIRAEALLALALLAGWALVTLSIASLSPRVARVAWPLSTGLLLLSLCGWRFLGALVSHGLYTLTREDAKRG